MAAHSSTSGLIPQVLLLKHYSYSFRLTSISLVCLGTMNSMVYPVYGGMEDWIYAGGWDSASVQQHCRGLPADKAMAVTQAAVFLVETSNRKSPSEPELGCESGVLANADSGVPFFPGSNVDVGLKNPSCNGHVQRNIRLTLTSIDMIQPYVCFSSISTRFNAETGASNLRGSTLSPLQSIEASWYVGGGHRVNATWISLHPAPQLDGRRHRPHVRYRIACAPRSLFPLNCLL